MKFYNDSVEKMIHIKGFVSFHKEDFVCVYTGQGKYYTYKDRYVFSYKHQCLINRPEKIRKYKKSTILILKHKDHFKTLYLPDSALKTIQE